MSGTILRLASASLDHLFLVACAIIALATCARFLKRTPAKAVKPLLCIAAIGVGLFLIKDINPFQSPEESKQAARAELDSLNREFDDLHMMGILNAPASSRQYSYGHQDGRARYHNNCPACDRNIGLKKRMDAIYRQYPSMIPSIYNLPTLPGD